MKRGQFQATVVINEPLCREHFRLVLRVAHFPSTRPGQFVQVSCMSPDFSPDESPDREWSEGERLAVSGSELASPLALLRRPFSLAGRRDTAAGVELDLIHRVVGRGTHWLSLLQPGDTCSILGPLGNSFTLPPPSGLALLVGGGVGIPPMIYLASILQTYNAVAFCGALSHDLLALTVDASALATKVDALAPALTITEFARQGIPSVITTDDGSYGFRGFVTQALEAYLDRHVTDAGLRQSTVIYTCGPEPMMKRVQEIARQRSIPTQIAVERAMACGMGTCQSCCVRIKKPDATRPPLAGKDWCYRLACTDGPVFSGDELLW